MLSVGRYSTESNVIYSETSPVVAHYVTGVGLAETTIKLSGLDTDDAPVLLRRNGEAFQVVVRGEVVADMGPGATAFSRPTVAPRVTTDAVVAGDVDVAGRIEVTNAASASTTTVRGDGVVTPATATGDLTAATGRVDALATTDVEVGGRLAVDEVSVTPARRAAAEAGGFEARIAVVSALDLEEPVTCHRGVFVGGGLEADRVRALDPSVPSEAAWLSIARAEMEEATATDVRVTRSLRCDLTDAGAVLVSSRADLFKMSVAPDALFVHNRVRLADDRRLGLGTAAPAADLHVVSGSGAGCLRLDLVPFRAVTEDAGYRALSVRIYDGQSSTYNSTIRADSTAAVDDPGADAGSAALVRDLFYVDKSGATWARQGLYTDGQVFAPAVYTDTIAPAAAAFVDVRGTHFLEGGVVDSVARLTAARVDAADLFVTGALNLSESSQLDVGRLFRYHEPVGEGTAVTTVGDAIGQVVRFAEDATASAPGAEAIEETRRVGEFLHTARLHSASGKEVVHATVDFFDPEAPGVVRWKLTDRHVTSRMELNSAVYTSARDGVHHNHTTEASYVAGTALRVDNPADGSRKTAVLSLLGTLMDYESNEHVGPASQVDAHLRRHVLVGTDTVPADGAGDALHVEGGARVSGALRCGALSETSDARMKRDVRDLRVALGGGATPALDATARLRPVEFAWSATGERDVGFLAQEVARADVHPALAVAGEGGEARAVRYTRAVPLLVAAVLELREEVAALRAALRAATSS